MSEAPGSHNLSRSGRIGSVFAVGIAILIDVFGYRQLEREDATQASGNRICNHVLGAS